METDKIGKELRTSKNKSRREAKAKKQLAKDKESRKLLIKQLGEHNIKLPRHICFSRTKMKVALAEIKKFPRSKPGILALSWKRFLGKSNLAQIARGTLGNGEFKEVYLRHVGRKYREDKKS